LSVGVRRRLLALFGPRQSIERPLCASWRSGPHEGLASVPGNPGEFTWNGAYGTQFFCDPKEHLVVVVGTAAPGELRKYYREQVQDIVYDAMVR
jgi:CubicO group peptidase (beta-lactamase class C family)